MPPKRQRAAGDELAPARKSTRSSAATASSKAAGSSNTSSSKRKAEGSGSLGGEDVEMEPPPAKKAKGRTKSATKSKSRPTHGSEVVTEVSPSGHADSSSILKQPPKKVPKLEPYSATAALQLFLEYADPDEQDTIGMDGIQKLCTDLDFSMEGPLPVILAWQMNSKEMGKLTKTEWVTGTGKLKISNLTSLKSCVLDLEALLMNNEAPQIPSKGDRELYDRHHYWGYANSPKDAFRQMYMYSFGFVKPENSRNIDMDTSLALWSVLLVPRFPLMGEIVQFIKDKGTYRATNKDLWSMMLEFCTTFDGDVKLQDYTPDGEWPTLFDEFVEWKRAGMT